MRLLTGMDRNTPDRTSIAGTDLKIQPKLHVLSVLDKKFWLRNEPVHEISNNMVCATSKGSDQPAHTRSLTGAFASCLSIQRVLSY